MDYIRAEYNKSAYHCPFSSCGTYAKQTWNAAWWLQPVSNNPTSRHHVQIGGLVLAICDHCNKFSVWLNGKLLYPATRNAPAPHADMPQSIELDYEEARAVFQDSARSSAALLRLVVQKLCIALGQPGKNLNADIGELVKQGLPVRIQQALDIVRVVGNNQVHPGVLDIRDDPAIALALFELVNVIVEDRIAEPKRIEALYAKLPEGARKQIEQRDMDAEP